MRIDRHAHHPPWAEGPEPKKSPAAHHSLSDAETFVDIPLKSGIENKVSQRELFQAENKKLIAELAEKQGLDPMHLYTIQFLWLLHDPSTRAEAAEVLRRMLVRD
ncbi:hypothetical protein [Estrella lausannensis]|uniref:Uncharacterized protein n=1 Tax=Estrella lausannensis TaxID=483423 RepID=A0A0H5DRS5_9BACT|nr:hypothetical protein [Estrella lausannensis]CRX38419.1 hypothetical protein ELAC_1075 [Estrella lausannensis]